MVTLPPGTPWSPDVGGGPLWARTWRVSSPGYPGHDVLELMLEEVGPQVARQSGFAGASVLVDRTSGDLLTATFWESPADLEASTRASVSASAAWQALGDGAGPREQRTCDVLAALPFPAVADRGLVPPSAEARPPRGDADPTEPAVSAWSPDVGGGPLWARCWTLEVPGYPALDSQELVVEVVLPRMASQPGFTGGHVVIDQATGDVLTTTFWRSLADLEASARAAAQASSAAEVLSEGGLTRDLRTCDVLALLPAPTVAHPHLLPPGSEEGA